MDVVVSHAPASGCRACRKLRAAAWRAKHPGANKLANTYRWMLARCYDKHHAKYENYGGAGVTVCRHWLGESGFERFCEDMGNPPTPKHTLDRKSGARGYYKANCRWATVKEQNRNLSTNKFITHDGRTLTLGAWAEIAGVHRNTLGSRLGRGWSMSRALGEVAGVPF